MGKIGVVYEIMLNEKDYTYDTFTFDLGRLVNTVKESKQFADNIEKRKEFLLKELHVRVEEMGTEDYRTLIINYMATLGSIKQALKNNPLKSLGITMHRKMDKTDIAVMQWPDFEKVLKNLPPSYFKE